VLCVCGRPMGVNGLHNRQTIREASSVAGNTGKGKGQSYLDTGLDRLLRFQDVENPRFPADRHMKVERFHRPRQHR
jgi:hypothetical protein